LGLLVLGERPVLQLLQVRPLLEYPARVALPPVHPLAICTFLTCDVAALTEGIRDFTLVPPHPKGLP
jgi:hypothetical protein